MSRIRCIVWEVTLKCNAKCIHCGSSAGCRKEDELTEDVALDICNQIGSLGIKSVNIIGGELFLRSDWKQIIHTLRSYNINVSIVTNGICLNKQVLGYLANEGIQTIGISIDGGLSATHDYIRQVPNLYNHIFRIVEENETPINFTAITTLNKINYKELPILLYKLVKSKFNVWEIQTASPHGRMTSDLALSREEYYFTGIRIAQARQEISCDELAIVCNHDYGYYSDFIPRITIYNQWQGCPAGISTLGIKYNGDVQGCLSLDYTKFRECSLLDNKLSDIISSDKLFCWNHKDYRQNTTGGYCKSCKYSKMCMGGCSDVAYSYTKNVANNPQCFYAIEQYYKNKDAHSDFDVLFKKMINGKIENGNIYLQNGLLLSKKILEQYNLNSQENDLFKYILDKGTNG